MMANENKAVTLDSLRTIFSAFRTELIKTSSLKNAEHRKHNIVEPANDDLPTIYITGKVPTKKENVTGKLKYVSKTHEFTSYIKYKLQGSYTMTFPKKNFTIQLFDDEERLFPCYQNFKNWGENYQFTLKADYADITHARNVVCARLWSKVVESRHDYDSLPEELRQSPNNGATDGFPVLVYLNNQYYGVYVLTITKSAWMFGMDKNNENHVALNAETNDNGNENLRYNPCNFNAEWSGEDGHHWSYEVGKDARDTWNKLYTYIHVSPDKTVLERYLDIQSAIDYYIFQNVVYGLDGLAKNMMLLTYDKTKWYVSAYDMDSTFGMLSDSMPLFGYSGGYEMAGEYPFQNQFSELWAFITQNYWDEIVNRFEELLDANILSPSSIINEFENFIIPCNEDICIKDTIMFPSIPNVEYGNMYWITQFLYFRFEVLSYYILDGGLLDA